MRMSLTWKAATVLKEELHIANNVTERNLPDTDIQPVTYEKDKEQRQFLLLMGQHCQKQPGTAKSGLPGPSW